MIRIVDLEKSFGPLRVLDRVSLDLPEGSVTAVLGPNASGKSTLIKCMLGLVRPDAGRVLFDGEDVVGQWRYRERVGYMPQAARYPEQLTVGELFALLRDLRGHRGELDIELFARYDLGAIDRRRFGTLSGGTRQKISAQVAFLFHPDVVVLDEPTVGLDPVAASVLKDKIRRERDAGRTIVLTSHLVNEIEELADRIVFLLEGRPEFVGTPEELKSRTGAGRLDRAVVRIMEGTRGTAHV